MSPALSVRYRLELPSCEISMEQSCGDNVHLPAQPFGFAPPILLNHFFPVASTLFPTCQDALFVHASHRCCSVSIPFTRWCTNSRDGFQKVSGYKFRFERVTGEERHVSDHLAPLPLSLTPRSSSSQVVISENTPILEAHRHGEAFSRFFASVRAAYVFIKLHELRAGNRPSRYFLESLIWRSAAFVKRRLALAMNSR